MMPLLLISKGFYIPSGIVVNGNFVSEKHGSIAGTINGDVQVKATLVIEKNGIINGDLQAKDLIIKGRVNGTIYCEGKVCLLKEAVVAGNIFASESRIDKLSILKGVISHINAKKETGDDVMTEEAPEEITIPLVPENVMPEEPPQSWF